MPDFTFKNNFPIAEVINAAQRKAALEQQNKTEGNQQLLAGLQSIGQVGQSLVDKRMKVAQALALGKQFGMDENVARNMDAEQILKVQAINKGMVDADFLKMAVQALAGRGTPNPDTKTALATPASSNTPASNGAVLASNTTSTPMPVSSLPPSTTDQVTDNGSNLPGFNPTMLPDQSYEYRGGGVYAKKHSSTIPVPIQAPPVKPRMVNPATAKMALDVAKANALEPVMTRSAAEEQGGVKHGTHILPDANLNISEKENQFYQREWDKLLKESDPLNASSRTPLGLASRATFQANRALKTLSNPVVTNQEAGNAMADIAAIYQNGSPTQFGMSHQEYKTVYGKVQGVLQAISGKPQDALPDAIKNRLVGVLNDMKATNSSLLKQRLDLTEHSKKAVISHFPDEWKEYRQILEGDQTSYSGLNSSGGQTATGLPQVGDAYNGGKVLSIKRIK